MEIITGYFGDCVAKIAGNNFHRRRYGNWA
jgi:hypothetical protein